MKIKKKSSLYIFEKIIFLLKIYNLLLLILIPSNILINCNKNTFLHVKYYKYKLNKVNKVDFVYFYKIQSYQRNK